MILRLTPKAVGIMDPLNEEETERPKQRRQKPRRGKRRGSTAGHPLL